VISGQTFPPLGLPESLSDAFFLPAQHPRAAATLFPIKVLGPSLIRLDNFSFGPGCLVKAKMPPLLHPGFSSLFLLSDFFLALQWATVSHHHRFRPPVGRSWRGRSRFFFHLCSLVTPLKRNGFCSSCTFSFWPCLARETP